MKNEDIILVRNKKTYNGKFETVLIDRTTRFGNPLFMNDESERDIVIERFAYMLKSAIKKCVPDMISALQFLEMKMYEAVKRNEPLVLLCHCYPKKCHGDIYKQMLLNKYYKNYWLVDEACDKCGHKESKIGIYGL